MDEIVFGTAGIPHGTPNSSTENGVKYVSELGLGSMELEFVHGVNISEETAREAGRIAEENNVRLTCHAPYYINLNAEEKEKRQASRERIIKSARIASEAGAWSVCFHPGYYLGQEPSVVYETVEEEMNKVMNRVDDLELDIWIRPETCGKTSQFGSIEPLIKLSEQFDQVLPCIDWAHLCARTIGETNDYESFKKILEKVKNRLGKEALNNSHMHIEGIEYGDKGEIRHQNFEDSTFDYENVVKVFKEYNIKGVITCESPNLEEDALTAKKYYNQL